MNARSVAILGLVLAVGARADTELKIVTTEGFVAFTVADHWPVLRMDTEQPIMAAVFQLPNAADQGTPDSTNLAIRFFDLKAQAAQESFRRVGEPIESDSPERSSLSGWAVYRQKASQGATRYSILDAKRTLTTLSVSVRLAWPHLEKNPPTYDVEMQQVYESVLRSVYEHIGPYEPGENEVIRRHAP